MIEGLHKKKDFEQQRCAVKSIYAYKKGWTDPIFLGSVAILASNSKQSSKCWPLNVQIVHNL